MANIMTIIKGWVQGELIIINKKNDNEIKVVCGRKITRDFAKKSFLTSLQQLL